MIGELVLNHTSDQHPWFQRARHAPPGSPWRELLRLERHTRPVRRRQDHLHRHGDLQLGLGSRGGRPLLAPLLQPPAGPELRKPARSGRRCCDRRLLARPRPRRTAARCGAVSLRGRRDELREPGGDARLPARAPAPRGRAVRGTGCCWRRRISCRKTQSRTSAQGAATSATWRSTSRSCRASSSPSGTEDRFPIVDILEQTPPIPETAQWAIFLRNHDELTLEMVTDEERDYMYRAYGERPCGPDQRRHPAATRAAGRRRRGRLELLYGLLLSLPGDAGALLRRRDRDGR